MSDLPEGTRKDKYRFAKYYLERVITNTKYNK